MHNIMLLGHGEVVSGQWWGWGEGGEEGGKGGGDQTRMQYCKPPADMH